jgi:hypothetical protein
MLDFIADPTANVSADYSTERQYSPSQRIVKSASINLNWPGVVNARVIQNDWDLTGDARVCEVNRRVDCIRHIADVEAEFNHSELRFEAQARKADRQAIYYADANVRGAECNLEDELAGRGDGTPFHNQKGVIAACKRLRMARLVRQELAARQIMAALRRQAERTMMREGV